MDTDELNLDDRYGYGYMDTVNDSGLGMSTSRVRFSPVRSSGLPPAQAKSAL